MSPRFRLLAWSAVAVTLCVIVLGAYVRLSHAGLGCPDWPGCYGHATWPNQSDEIAAANQAFPQRAVEVPKAWREMVHRFLAGGLGLMVLALAWMGSGGRLQTRLAIAGSALLAIAAMTLYTVDWRNFALLPAALAIVLPVAAALRLQAPAAHRFAVATLGVIIFQALLGKWTVTLQLKPIVVTAHLMGGMTTFAMLLWAALNSEPRWSRARSVSLPLAGFAVAVVAAQIFLGGWVSTNYAALSCPEFPTCLGRWWQGEGLAEGFVLFREIGVNYEGGILDGAARAAIHMLHRWGALATTLVVALLCLGLWRRGAGQLAAAILAILVVQIALGISNVVFDLPLPVATAHNGVAALLLGAVLVAFWHARQSALRVP
jgi:cytochrome c oxidase assembly protein subunit 15